ncbi:MAG: carboxy terminal-processing peptidase [Granulosicoccus sp.]|nr:carboxy terminal-processing peptidase [Granulosicoccus sp.]
MQQHFFRHLGRSGVAIRQTGSRGSMGGPNPGSRTTRFGACASSAIALCLALVGTVNADGRAVSLATLAPTTAHQQEAAVILQLMEGYHYKRVPVGDELSEQIFDRFLESLDPQKAFLLRSDIEEFGQYRRGFDDALRKSQLRPVFDIFKRFRARVEERAAYARSLLQKEFDFTIEETYTFDREMAQWPASQFAVDELWRKRVKNDVLNLRLAEQSREELIETLEQRYEQMERRISQLAANDVFQIFINAYTLSVEPHTSYFSPRTSENFEINMSLSLEGIGAALQTEDEYTVVQRVIAGGPAAMSEQLSEDDRIVGVGQGEDEEIVDVVSWSLNDVVDLIRGPKGSTVRLEILPASAPEGAPPKVITLVRDKIKLEEQAAKSSVVEVPGTDKARRFGVIDLPTFYHDSAGRAQGLADYRSTTRDVRNLLSELTTAEGGVDGVIIDLRGNGGGSLLEATELTGLFIETGPIVQIRGATGRVDLEEDNDAAVAYDGPLAVLVDRGSASASEIFAAAIQDYGRGVILGEPTFGKGTVQTVVPLDREGKLGQLKVTIAQFFRVNGEGTQHRGVVPDVLFPTALDSDAQGERGLDNALPWAGVEAANYDAWSDRKANYSQLQARHESRYRASDTFKVLIEELEAQQKARAESSVSLVESVRQQALLERRAGREEREELYRRAFGASGSDGDDDQETDGVPDIILNEAARVLNDVIDASV